MKRPLRWQRRHAAVVLVGAVSLVAGAAVALKGRRDSSAASDAGPASGAAPAPEGLLCDLYVTTPNASWSKLQRGIGGAVGILPATVPGMIAALTELDATLVSEIDGASPMYGAAAGDPADPGFAFAMRLVDPRRARALLTEGGAALYAPERAPGMTLLVANRAASSVAQNGRSVGLAISDEGYLLLARSSADLARLGPYVTRTLAARPLPRESAAVLDVPRSALRSILRPRLESYWREGSSFLLMQDERMRAERGRGPDFADPAAIVGALDAMVSRRVALVGDLDRVRVALDVTEDAAAVTATLSPGPGEPNTARTWIEAMRVGDASAVLDLPSTSALALSTRDGENERLEQAKALSTAIASAVGTRMKEPEKLREAIDAMTKARDESLAVALGLDEPAGLLVRAPVRDRDAEDEALRAAVELARVAPFKELLRVRDVSWSSDELAEVGKISLARVTREPPRRPEGLLPSRGFAADAGIASAGVASTRSLAVVGVAWGFERGALALAAGPAPLVTLKAGVKPDKRLADEPSLRSFTAALGSDASTVIIGQPLHLDPKRSSPPMAPLGIAVGKKGGDAFVRFHVSDSLLREAARRQMGF